MENQSTPLLSAFRIVDYDKDALRDEGFVQFVAEVTATTRFLHPLARRDPCPQFLISTRYADLLDVHTQLRSRFESLWMPEFPPKKFIGNKKPEFIEARIQLLNEYFSAVLEFPDVRTSEPVMKLVSPRHSLKFAVLGRKGLPMHEFVQCFTQLPAAIAGSLGGVTIDLLVKRRLYRVSTIDVIETDLITDERELLERVCGVYNGIVFCYVSGEQAGTLRLFDRIGDKYPKMLVDLSQEVLNGHIAYSVFYSLTNLI